jgi:hypothetical protein
MTDFQELAAKELNRWGTTNPERGIQKASVLAYMARTEALKPEPVVKAPDSVWIITQRTGGGDFGILKVFIEDSAAQLEYNRLYKQSQQSNGYWEVFINEFSVSS